MSVRTTTPVHRSSSPPPLRRGPSGPVLFVVFLALAIVGALVFGFATSGDDGGDVPPASLPEPLRIPTRDFTLENETFGDLTLWHLPRGVPQPKDVAIGADGEVWVTESANAAVGVLRGDSYTRTLLVGAFAEDDPVTFQAALLDGGDLWFTGYPGAGVGRLVAPGEGNYFSALNVQAASAVGIATAGDVVWVTDPALGSLTRVTTSTPATVRTVPIDGPAGSAEPPQPYAITQGPDGAMWFTDPSTRAIGRVESGARRATEVAYPIDDQYLVGIAASPDGGIWVGLTPKQSRLLRIDPATGTWELVTVEDGIGGIQELAVAPDGTLWVPQIGFVLHVRPDGSTIERFDLPEGVPAVDGIEVAPDGTVWMASLASNTLVEIAP